VFNISVPQISSQLIDQLNKYKVLSEILYRVLSDFFCITWFLSDFSFRKVTL